jgi:hypothetical protein
MFSRWQTVESGIKYLGLVVEDRSVGASSSCSSCVFATCLCLIRFIQKVSLQVFLFLERDLYGPCVKILAYLT